MKTIDLSPRAEFTRRAAVSLELHRRLAHEAERKRRETEKADEKDRSDAELMDLVQAVVLASGEEIRNFEFRLDRQDAATIEALMENEKELLAVRARIEERLSRAYRLPDGRRVFESEDGIRVFDEFGAEVASDVISADEIPDHLDRFEPYWTDRLDERSLTQERDELLDHQQRLDGVRSRYQAAREQAGEDGLAKGTLDDLEAEIDAATPARVRKLLGQSADPDAPVARKADATATADDLEVDDDMVPDAVVRKAPAPGFEG